MKNTIKVVPYSLVVFGAGLFVGQHLQSKFTKKRVMKSIPSIVNMLNNLLILLSRRASPKRIYKNTLSQTSASSRMRSNRVKNHNPDSVFLRRNMEPSIHTIVIVDIHPTEPTSKKSHKSNALCTCGKGWMWNLSAEIRSVVEEHALVEHGNQVTIARYS